MSSNTHKSTLDVKDQKQLEKSIKFGGRNSALGDFNKVLGEASKGKK